jgi:hypothetical protein
MPNGSCNSSRRAIRAWASCRHPAKSAPRKRCASATSCDLSFVRPLCLGVFVVIPTSPRFWTLGREGPLGPPRLGKVDCIRLSNRTARRSVPTFVPRCLCRKNRSARRQVRPAAGTTSTLHQPSADHLKINVVSGGIVRLMLCVKPLQGTSSARRPPSLPAPEPP